MLSHNLAAKFAAAAALAALVVLPACSINVKDKNKEGHSAVDIKTPVGDLHVDEQPDIRESGLSVYPGARPAPKEAGEDKKSANVNLSVPGFALKVVAAEFASDDPSDKVLAYYNKELQKYGKAIQCRGPWHGGDVAVNADKGAWQHKDGDGLSKPVSCRDSGAGDSVELKVGTEGNQHLVAIKSEGKGTRFALVYIRARTGKENTI
jgi:hypothetical protein